MLLLYTDGVTEARSPLDEEFAPARLVDFMRQSARRPASDMVRDLRRTLQDFTQGLPLLDDTTIIAGRLTD
jgi:sigma-B regulation protein RsbU (phosphoserine phosphatase)